MLQFHTVFTHENLKKAAKKIAKRNVSAGFDKMNPKDVIPFFNRKYKRDIIIKKLKRGDFRPHKSKKAFIPKENGQKREIKIQSVIDRVVLDCFANSLDLKYSSNFSKDVFAYIPGVGAHDAIHRISKLYSEDYTYALKVDLKNFFDTIPHNLLFNKLEKIIDYDLIRVINSFISNKWHKGVQQGNPISPFLSNLHLDEFDKWIEERKGKYMIEYLRYADDILILSKTPTRTELFDEIIAKLKSMKVEVNKNKTCIGLLEETSFLGFIQTPNGLIVSAEKIDKMESKIDKLLSQAQATDGSIYDVIGVNNYVRGWISYYRVADLNDITKAMNDKITCSLKSINLIDKKFVVNPIEFYGRFIPKTFTQ